MVSVLFTVPQYLPLGEGRTYCCWMPYLPTNHYYLCSLMVSFTFIHCTSILTIMREQDFLLLDALSTNKPLLSMFIDGILHFHSLYLNTCHYERTGLIAAGCPIYQQTIIIYVHWWYPSLSFTVPQYLPLWENRTYCCWMPYLPTNHYYLCSLMVSFTFIHCTSILTIMREQDFLLLDALSTNKPLLSMFIDGILHFHSLYLNTCHYREQDLLLLDALSINKPLLSMFIDGICFIHCTSILAIMREQDLLLLDALSTNIPLLSMFIDGILHFFIHCTSILAIMREQDLLLLYALSTNKPLLSMFIDGILHFHSLYLNTCHYERTGLIAAGCPIYQQTIIIYVHWWYPSLSFTVPQYLPLWENRTFYCWMPYLPTNHYYLCSLMVSFTFIHCTSILAIRRRQDLLLLDALSTNKPLLSMFIDGILHFHSLYLNTCHYERTGLIAAGCPIYQQTIIIYVHWWYPSLSFTVPQYLPLWENRTFYCWMPYLPTNHYYLCSLMVSFTFIHCTSILAIMREQDLLLLDALSTNKPLLSMFIDGILHFHSLYLNTCHYREQDLLLLDALSINKPLLSMFIDGICFIHCTSIPTIMREQDLLLLDALSTNKPLLSMFIDGICFIHCTSILAIMREQDLLLLDALSTNKPLLSMFIDGILHFHSLYLNTCHYERTGLIAAGCPIYQQTIIIYVHWWYLFHSLYLNTCHYREQDLLLLDALSINKPLLSMFIDGICFIHCTSIPTIMREQDLLLLDALSTNKPLLSMFIDGICFIHCTSILAIMREQDLLLLDALSTNIPLLSMFIDGILHFHSLYLNTCHYERTGLIAAGCPIYQQTIIIYVHWWYPSLSFTVPQYLPLWENRTFYCWMPYLPTNHYYLCSLMVSFTFIHCTSILTIMREQDFLLLDALSTNKPLLSMFIDGILHFHSLYLNTCHYERTGLIAAGCPIYQQTIIIYVHWWYPSLSFTVPQYLPLGEGRTYCCWMPYLSTSHYYLCSLMVSVLFTVPQFLPLWENRTFYCWMPYLPTNHYYLCSLMVSVLFTVPQYLPLWENRTYCCWMPYLSTSHYYLCSLMVSFTLIHCTSILAIRRGQDFLLLDALSTNKPLLSMFIDGICFIHCTSIFAIMREQDFLLLDALSTNKPLLSMFIDGILHFHSLYLNTYHYERTGLFTAGCPIYQQTIIIYVHWWYPSLSFTVPQYLPLWENRTYCCWMPYLPTNHYYLCSLMVFFTFIHCTSILAIIENRTYCCWMPYLPTNHYYLCSLMVSFTLIHCTSILAIRRGQDFLLLDALSTNKPLLSMFIDGICFIHCTSIFAIMREQDFLLLDALSTNKPLLSMFIDGILHFHSLYLNTYHYERTGLFTAGCPIYQQTIIIYVHWWYPSLSFTVPQYLPLWENRTYCCWMPYLPTNHYYLCSLMVSFTFIHCTSILAIMREQDLLLLDALSTNKPLLSMFIDGILHFYSLYLNTCH